MSLTRLLWTILSIWWRYALPSLSKNLFKLFYKIREPDRSVCQKCTLHCILSMNTKGRLPQWFMRSNTRRKCNICNFRNLLSPSEIRDHIFQRITIRRMVHCELFFWLLFSETPIQHYFLLHTVRFNRPPMWLLCHSWHAIRPSLSIAFSECKYFGQTAHINFFNLSSMSSVVNELYVSTFCLSRHSVINHWLAILSQTLVVPICWLVKRDGHVGGMYLSHWYGSFSITRVGITQSNNSFDPDMHFRTVRVTLQVLWHGRRQLDKSRDG